jgi:hypothetical protein
MILNTKYDEEVNGTVVGRYQLICSLRYDGRKQGSMIYADDEEEAKRVAEDRKAEIIRECGAAAKVHKLDPEQFNAYIRRNVPQLQGMPPSQLKQVMNFAKDASQVVAGVRGAATFNAGN